MTTCTCCGQPLSASGACLNLNCERAREDATRGAARATRKASAMAAANEPRAFTSSGRVD